SQLPLRPPGCHAITIASVVHGRKTRPSSGHTQEPKASSTLLPKSHQTASTNRGRNAATPLAKHPMRASSPVDRPRAMAVAPRMGFDAYGKLGKPFEPRRQRE